MSTDLQYKSNN